jgi:M6 family metalloprotease-like protein
MKRFLLTCTLLVLLILSGCTNKSEDARLDDYLDLSSIAYTYEMNGINYVVNQFKDDFYFVVTEGDKTYEGVLLANTYYGKTLDGAWYEIDHDNPLFDDYRLQVLTFKTDALAEIDIMKRDTEITVENTMRAGAQLFHYPSDLRVTYLNFTHDGSSVTNLVATIENLSTGVQYPYQIEVIEPTQMPEITTNSTYQVGLEDLDLYPTGVTLTIPANMQSQAEFGTLLSVYDTHITISNDVTFVKGLAVELSFRNGLMTNPLTVASKTNIAISHPVELTLESLTPNKAFFFLTDATITDNTATSLTVTKNNQTYVVLKSTTLSAQMTSTLFSLPLNEIVHLTSLVYADNHLYFTNDSELEMVSNPTVLSFTPSNDTKRLSDISADFDVTMGIPSKGNPKLLVIPIAFSNYPAPSNMTSRLETTLFGNAAVTGFESLQSYYYKSSYGQLFIEGTVLAPYQTNKTAAYYENLYLNGNDTVDYDIMQDAIEFYDSTTDFSLFDSDSDSYIDAIMLVYTAPVSFDSGADLWWAYVYQYYDQQPAKYDDVEMNFYMFVGYDFVDELFNFDKNQSIPFNATTFIHETGHLLGLDDYYDYDLNAGPAGGIGGGDMMDYAVGDHNPFSKLLLGWITPEVSNKTSGTFTLKPFESSGEALIIPKLWQGSYFDEYLIIDFYTPTGLNSAHAGYNGLFSTSGIRIYHISAGLNTYQNADTVYTVYKNNNSDTFHKLIKLIEADGRNDITNTRDSDYGLPSENSDLFKVNQMLQNYTWNDGTPVDFSLIVNTITASEATFTVTFN